MGLLGPASARAQRIPAQIELAAPSDLLEPALRLRQHGAQLELRLRHALLELTPSARHLARAAFPFVGTENDVRAQALSPPPCK